MVVNKNYIFLIFGIIIFSSLTSSVSAESSTSSSSYSPGGFFGIIFLYWMINSINKAENIAIKEAGDNCIGVAGWLLFFIGESAVIGIIAVLRIISDIIQIVLYAPSLFSSYSFIFTEILDLISGVAFIVAAYYLWKVKPGAKWLMIGVLIFDILVIGVNWLVSIDEIYLALSIIGLIESVIMIIYFLTSRRVKNTYVLNTRIPKNPASSNKTVINWIVFRAIMVFLLFAVFQSSSWADTSNFAKDKPCTDYCSQYQETDSYYFGYDDESAGLICQCQKNGEVIASTSIPINSSLSSNSEPIHNYSAEITGGTNEERQVVKYALWVTSNDTKSKIRYVNITTPKDVSDLCGADSFGCMIPVMERSGSRDLFKYADIYVVRAFDYDLNKFCNTFPNTIYYEIGLVVALNENLYISGTDGTKFAEDYANRFERKAC